MKLFSQKKDKEETLKKKFLTKLTSFFAITVLVFSVSGYFFGGRAIATTTTFATSGSWTVPSGVSTATFEAWGGGGAGGASSTSTTGGSGGAGGQYAKKTLSGLVVGSIYTVTVATSTAGGTGNGSAGGSSSVANPSSTTVVMAKGGAGGAANAGAGGAGSTTGGIGDTVYAGGSGGVGSPANVTPSFSGGGGGGAGSTGAGGNTSSSTAGTGTANNGGNGGAGVTTKSAGNAGANYGGGGSGGLKTNGGTQNGGSGAPGLVTVTYTTNSAPNAPALTSPANAGTVSSTTPNLAMSATDPDGDAVKYKVFIYNGVTTSGGNCSGTSFATSDQTSSGTGWDNGTTAYASGATATYTVQTAMANGNGYCWQAQAIDPSGSNTFGSLSSAFTFTINTVVTPTTDQLMRGGQYFNNGSEQSYYWAQ